MKTNTLQEWECANCKTIRGYGFHIEGYSSEILIAHILCSNCQANTLHHYTGRTVITPHLDYDRLAKQVLVP